MVVACMVAVIHTCEGALGGTVILRPKIAWFEKFDALEAITMDFFHELSLYCSCLLAMYRSMRAREAPATEEREATISSSNISCV